MEKEFNMEQDIQYIKRDAVYQVRKRRNYHIDSVRYVPIWLLIPLLLLLVLGGYLVFNGIGQETTGQTAYTVEGEADYQVYLKENDYYVDKYLGKDMTYIANLINLIHADFTYKLAADDNIDAHYTYELVADTKATDKSDKTKILYEKSELLKAADATPVLDGELNLHESIDIDYDKYNAMMRAFRQDFGINANCFLDLRFMVKMDGAIKTEDALVLNIPLSDQTIDIAIDTKAINRAETVGEAKLEFYIKDWKLLTVGGVMFVASLIASIILLYLYKTRYGNNWYEEAKDKILKRYDTMIINVEESFTEPDDTVRVGEFKELLDAAEGEGVQVKYYEVEPGNKAYFVVKGLTDTYRYTLSQAYQQERRKTGQGKEF